MSVALKTFIVLVCSVALMACTKPESQAPSAMNPAASAARLAYMDAPPVVPVAVAPVTAEYAVGKRVFDKTCGLCHGAGTGGSPRPGDKANWAPRIAQGKDTLYRHALEGFNGAAGYMPAHGGDAAVTNSDVIAGVDYMVSQSR